MPLLMGVLLWSMRDAIANRTSMNGGPQTLSVWFESYGGNEVGGASSAPRPRTFHYSRPHAHPRASHAPRAVLFRSFRYASPVRHGPGVNQL